MKSTELLDIAVTAAGGTQTALADTLGTGKSRVSDWYHGRAKPNLVQFANLLKLAGITDARKIQLAAKSFETPRRKNLECILC